MTLTEFVNTYNGASVGDGQCVALVFLYQSEVQGLTPEPVGNAVDYYRQFYNTPFLYNNYNLITYTGSELPQARRYNSMERKSRWRLWTYCNRLSKLFK